MPDTMEYERRTTQVSSPSADCPDRQEDVVSLWEWIVAGVGVALVVGSFGFLGYEAFRGQISHPDIVVQVDAILPVRTGYLVQINVLNQGDATAATLKIEGLLLQGTKQVEMSETTIDYVPAHSKRKGGLFFASDPRRVTLQLRAKGYEEP